MSWKDQVHVDAFKIRDKVLLYSSRVGDLLETIANDGRNYENVHQLRVEINRLKHETKRSEVLSNFVWECLSNKKKMDAIDEVRHIWMNQV